MSTSFGALCNDFYVNQKFSLKMDLPSDRETVLHFFDRVRKSEPSMERFLRYDGELALESSRREANYSWLALRRTSVRTGYVNPQSMEQAYKLHKMILEVAPYHLSVSPLDVDYLELLFGFDLECESNHDEVVYDALIANSPMAELLKVPDSRIMEVQPMFGIALSNSGDLQAHFEVKTRARSRRGQTRRSKDEPISIFVILRKYGPIKSLEALPEIFDTLAEHAERLAAENVIPNLVTPIARQITSSSA